MQIRHYLYDKGFVFFQTCQIHNGVRNTLKVVNRYLQTPHQQDHFSSIKWATIDFFSPQERLNRT